MSAWLVPISKVNWEIYKKNEFRFLAFPYRTRKTVSKPSVGDVVVLYLASRISAISGLVTIISTFEVDKLIPKVKSGRKNTLNWEERYPCRIKTKPTFDEFKIAFDRVRNLG